MTNKIKKIKIPNKKNIIYFIEYLVLTLISVIFIYILVVLSIKTNVNSSMINDQKINLIPTPTNKPPQKRWVLEKKANGESKIIAEFCDDCPRSSYFLEKWNDWIFYIDTHEITINGYNLNTGESKIIFDAIKEGYDLHSTLVDSVSDLIVIDNTLFFSLGGYAAKGAVFSVDLPPKTKPKKLVNNSSSAFFSFWENRYWVIGSEADGLWNKIDYYLLDLESKKVNFVITREQGSCQGEKYIGIDKRDRMIFAGYEDKNTNNIEFSCGDDDETPIYKYIFGISLSIPPIKEGIIAKQNMPSNIGSIEYLENTDQLYLIGYDDENYLYDFNSKSITKTDMPIPQDWYFGEDYPSPLSKYIIEDRIKELALPSGYSFEFK